MAASSVGTPILMYHGLRKAGIMAPRGDTRFWLRGRAFARHLRLFKEAGLTVVFPDAVLAGAPAGSLSIHFDDGRASDYEVALARLQEAGVAASFFINPGTIGKPDFLTWPQVRALAAAGMRIESHSWDHVDLSQLPPGELHRQLQRSKQVIEQHVGRRVEFLSAPYGAVNRRILEAALDLGYRAVCTSDAELAQAHCIQMPRFAIYGSNTDYTVLALARGEAWALAERRWRRRALAPARYLASRLRAA